MAGNRTPFLYTLCFFIYCVSRTYGQNKTVSNHVIGVESLLPETTCTKISTTGLKESPSVLKLHSIHSPCYTQKTPNYMEVLIQDQSRVGAINSRILKGGSFETPKKVVLTANSGMPLDTGSFFVTLGFGTRTPKRDLPLIFDTGSDLTWIQCLPCAVKCYTQRDPIFDPSQSTSYTNISCSSSACSTLSSGTGNIPGCSTSACVYRIQYGDKSFSIGMFGEETLTVSPLDVFPNFQFGCGQNNDGLFGQVAGLLGLGRDRISFVSQTATKYNKLFSYCIPSRSSGFLSFGVPSSVTNFIPLLTASRRPSFYFLDLQGISVGGNILSISPQTFSLGGTIIDSGTVITRLPPTVYTSLRAAFQQGMSANGYRRAPALSILDTCYDFTGLTTVTYPRIFLLFEGGKSLEVPFGGIFYIPSLSQVCLAFAGNTLDGDLTIIGNNQQKTLEVVYDVGAGLLGFGPGGCT